ncbi:MAG: hypothetical protein FWC47_05475 [Oscillospiraceae bacterium]|nr:hypothetical protein [Oscillospiraceae bacterium]
MNIEDCVNTIKASKKYNSICDETIIRISENEMKKNKSDKEIIKSVKTKLYQISGAFISDDSIKFIYKNYELSKSFPMVEALHSSTAERISFAKEMYRDIFSVTGDECSILDIGCGLNPFFLGNMKKLYGGKYFATDINLKLIKLLNIFFASTNIDGHAFPNDVLYKVPDIHVENVFLFKILPLFEQQQKGSSKRIIEEIDSEYFTITFPTKTLSGKNVGMKNFYNNFIKNNFTEEEFEYCFEKEYINELLYIIKKK